MHSPDENNPVPPIRAIANQLSDFAEYPAMPAAVEQFLREHLDGMAIEPVSATEWVCPAGWRRNGKRFADPLLICIGAGRGMAWVGGDAAPENVYAGDLLLIPRNVPHGIQPVGGRGMRLIIVHAYCTMLGAVELMDTLAFAGMFRRQPRTSMYPTFHDLAREFALQPPGWQGRMRAGLHVIMTELLRCFSARVKLPGAGRYRVETARLLPIFACIQRELGNPALVVNDLAQLAGVSTVYLRQLFRAGIGISPRLFLQKQRIHHAARLLRQGNLRLKEIAAACGFADVYYFHRVFRRLTGQTPREYRRVFLAQRLPYLH